MLRPLADLQNQNGGNKEIGRWEGQKNKYTNKHAAHNVRVDEVGGGGGGVKVVAVETVFVEKLQDLIYGA